MKKISCRIVRVEKLNHDVYQVVLMPPKELCDERLYKAGQYLDLFLPSGKGASFSIGSAPQAGGEIELHIRHNPQSEFSTALLEYLVVATEITAEIGKGNACIEAKDINKEDVIILAGASTGFSQIKSTVESLIESGINNPIHIYWGVRVASDLYWSLLPEQWSEQYKNIVFHPVISDPTDACGWTGRVSLLPSAILDDFESFAHVKMLASGSPAMVYALLDACEAKGMTEAQLVSDVFAYAPRP